MNLPRREFLKTTAAASAAAALTSMTSAANAPASSGREYYELRAYRLRPDGAGPLEAYLERAFIPALNARGVNRVGVFRQTTPVDEAVLWVLVPHSSLDSFARGATELNADATVRRNGADYLDLPKAGAAFERIDSWLLLAFAGMPRMELPAFSPSVAGRIFEMRMYESYSEMKAQKKVDMFNDGEIQVMRDVGLAPVFFGQALSGSNLPHLTYMTSATDAAAHKEHWDGFRVHPDWVRMRDDPQYADTVSKNIARILVPTSYSQI